MQDYPVEVETVDTGIQEVAPVQEFQKSRRRQDGPVPLLIPVNTGYLGAADPELTHHRAKEAGYMDLSANLARTRLNMFLATCHDRLED